MQDRLKVMEQQLDLKEAELQSCTAELASTQQTVTTLLAERQRFFAISTAVEALTKEYKAPILITAETYKQQPNITLHSIS